MSTNVYEASVFAHTVKYRNFQGVEKTGAVNFALDPLQLMQVIATFQPKKVKSGNPSLNGKDQEIDDESQLNLIRKLAAKSAGMASDDGESWVPFEDFDNSLIGKAFLTQLSASDSLRRKFSEKVILDPFRAFVGFVENDADNTPQDIQQFKTMLVQMENIFKEPERKAETVEDRRARLEAEMAALESTEAGE